MWFDIIKAEAQYEDHPELKKHGELYMEIKDIIKTQLNMNTMDVNQSYYFLSMDSNHVHVLLTNL